MNSLPVLYKPHEYQLFAGEHLFQKKAAALFLDMGLGKTVITLTVLNRLLYEEFAVKRPLVIAPLRVAQSVWTEEIAKWSHLKHLRASKILGPVSKRLEALRKPADIYIINRENLVWLITHYGAAFPFDCLVFDELSSFKDPGSKRFKAARMVIRKVKRVYGLTGTPAPNGLINLWSQLYLLDQGERLGKTITEYREKYFLPDKRSGMIIYSYKPVKTAATVIHDKIKDICISMQAKDYLKLPERINRVIKIKLSSEMQKKHDRFERYQVMALKYAQITAFNAAALTTKLLQFAGGAVYDSEKVYHSIHDEKLDALEELIEEAVGAPVLIFYNYVHELERIVVRFGATQLKTEKDIQDWNKGLIPVMIAHPASAGHGLNLQAGGNIIIWFGPTWSLELYQQANARLDRQGQLKPVIVHHLVVENTMDEDVMAVIESKGSVQDALLKGLKARIEKYSVNLVD